MAVNGIFGSTFGDVDEGAGELTHSTFVTITPPATKAPDGFIYAALDDVLRAVQGLRGLRLHNERDVFVLSATGEPPFGEDQAEVFPLVDALLEDGRGAWDDPKQLPVFIYTHMKTTRLRLAETPEDAVVLRPEAIAIGRPGVSEILQTAAGEGVTFVMRDGLAVLTELSTRVLTAYSAQGTFPDHFEKRIARGDVVMYALPDLGRSPPHIVEASDPNGALDIASRCSVFGASPDGMKYGILNDAGQPLIAAARKLIREQGKAVFQTPIPIVRPPAPQKASLGSIGTPLLVLGAAAALLYGYTRSRRRA